MDRHVRFSDQVQSLEVIAYSVIYGRHPRFLAATSEGWKEVSSHSDPYTGKAGMIMRERSAKLYCQERKAAAR